MALQYSPAYWRFDTKKNLDLESIGEFLKIHDERGDQSWPLSKTQLKNLYLACPGLAHKAGGFQQLLSALTRDTLVVCCLIVDLAAVCARSLAGPQRLRAESLEQARQVSEALLMPAASVAPPLPPCPQVERPVSSHQPLQGEDYASAVYCKVCQVLLNGPTQWEDHKIRKRHRKHLKRACELGGRLGVHLDGSEVH